MNNSQKMGNYKGFVEMLVLWLTSALIMVLVITTLSACGTTDADMANSTPDAQTEPEDDIERLQAELRAIQAELEAARQQAEEDAFPQKEELEQGQNEAVVEIQREIEAAQAELMALRELRATQSSTISIYDWPSRRSVEHSLAGRWYWTFTDGDFPNRTGGYLVHDFNVDGTVCTYRRDCWSEDEELIFERTWSKLYYVRVEEHIGHNNFTMRIESPMYLVNIYRDGEVPLEFIISLGRIESRSTPGLTLFQTSVGRAFREYRPPTPGWYYMQLANVSPLRLSGEEWFYSDLIWPIERDRAEPEVQETPANYRFHQDGNLIRRYFVSWPGSVGWDLVWVGRWSFSDNTVYLHYYTGLTTSFTFQGDELHSGNTILRTTLAYTEEHARALAQDAADERQRQNLEARFLGEWYFDVFIWNFFQDGTGYIDIPAFGIHPADRRDFTFMVINSDLADAIIDFDGDFSGMFRANFGNQSGGSVVLEPHITGAGGETFMLTRMFDINNTPAMDYIWEQGMGLFEQLFSMFP